MQEDKFIEELSVLAWPKGKQDALSSNARQYYHLDHTVKTHKFQEISNPHILCDMQWYASCKKATSSPI